MATALDEDMPRSGDLRRSHVFAAVGAAGWLAVAGAASLAAGAIHAAAIGVHSEHRQAVVTFTIVAAIQLAFGAAALVRPGRIVLALGALANVAFVVGWQLAKTRGISFIDGLDEVEPRQFTDTLSAALAAVAAVAVVVHLVRPRVLGLSRVPLLSGALAVAVAGLAVPGMIAAGGHVHSEGAAHDHGDTGTAAGAEGVPTADAGFAPGEVASAVPPKPYDPSLPLDLGGVEGVTPQQQARAENLLAATIIDLPQFADPVIAESMGFVSIGDGGTGHEHYLNPVNMNDDRLLDPDYPESLVYDTTVTPKKLVSAMFMMSPGDTLDDVPDIGGPLTQWHVHNNLCFAGPRVAGLTDGQGNCAPGLTKGAETPMIHVWISADPGSLPYECGPFTALEGVGAGTVAEGETRACDTAHAHDH